MNKVNNVQFPVIVGNEKVTTITLMSLDKALIATEQGKAYTSIFTNAATGRLWNPPSKLCIVNERWWRGCTNWESCVPHYI
jgi:hypothetical protein